jgi:hypothetical protein
MSLSINDSVVKWEAYNKENLFENFSCDDLNLIVTGIETSNEWNDFLNIYSDWVRCYVLRTCLDEKIIGFVYLYNEKGNFEIVSVHGGGWEKSLGHTLYYYRGLILLIERLILQGKKVRTSCFLGNDNALRFLRSVGFVKYLTTDNAHYMWINEQRLRNSKIYKFFYAF